MKRQDVIPLLRDTWSGFQEDEAGQLGAALSYYTMFSLFPLLLLLTAVLGYVLRTEDTQQRILAVVGQNISPQLGQSLESAMDSLADSAGAATAVGLITLLMGASGIFQQLNLSFNKIWKVAKPVPGLGLVTVVRATVTKRLEAFAMVLGVGVLLIASLVLTGLTQVLLQGAGSFLGYGEDSWVMQALSVALGLLITLLLNTLIFALLFRFLPDVDPAWGDVWLGALLTAVIWEVAKRLLAIYIGGSAYASAYGVVGTVLVLMAWIFFSSQVLFLGAEFTRAYAYRLGSRRPLPAPPQPDLVEPELPPEQPEAAAPAAAPGGLLRKLAIATGAGVLIGSLGSLLAALVALVLGLRRAAGLLAPPPGEK